ncbi:acylphosphatase [Patescibacteria group bacterium]
MKKHLNIRVKGKVQGVFYRYSTKGECDELGITGFVRNEPNGTVYLEVEGEEEALAQLVRWCNEGSQHAAVDDVEVREGDLKGFDSFTVER